jgi:hypothetical protein
MRQFLLRVLKSGLPACVLLAGFGFVLAEYAGTMVANHDLPRRDSIAVETTSQASNIVAGQDVAAQFRSRLPWTLPLWGLGFVVLFEGLRSLWIKPEPLPPAPDPNQLSVDELLNELAARVEAETSRTGKPNPNSTING